MRRAYSLMLSCVPIALAAMILRAAEPDPQAKSAAAEKPAAKVDVGVTEPVIPERKLEFDVSDEEYPLPLSVPSPSGRETRYKLEQLLQQKLSPRYQENRLLACIPIEIQG